MVAEVPVVAKVEELRNFVRARRQEGKSIGLTPTMGALHAGHLSLVEILRQSVDCVIVTIFVNPTQFSANEDFGRYPRQLRQDLEKLLTIKTDLVFAPQVEEMYSLDFSTRIIMGGPAQVDLEDRFRPTHFEGVATVVAKLLNQAQADVAIFGEKDYQQLQVIRHLARDLDLSTFILAGPTLREADGLALSSRNIYLSKEERTKAPQLYFALCQAADQILSGVELNQALKQSRALIEKAGMQIDYLELRHAESLRPVQSLAERPLRLLAAAHLGKTRLIDNIPVL
jgi:pantoate--beta-alanine ligase